MKKTIKSIISIILLLSVIIGSGNPLGIGTLRALAKIELRVDHSYSGFKLKSKKEIEEIKSTAYQFVHEKTGAKLLYLKNEDENKVFSITFRTPPKDNTGENHIIEHSVLCGSKKYPVRDPFTIMSKQSLNTFLNAMTSSDYTTYPISSKNEKDFENLMSVYLDAVFYPNIYKNKGIFQQEGWRYELDSPKGELKVNGIVYNEMKGVYSDPLAVLYYTINKSLFPNSIYRYEAGGYPDDIPKLTYKQFLETHRTNYTPSNSYIYLYGNLDIERTLKFINDNYLSRFNKRQIDTRIREQKPFKKMKNVVNFYSVPMGSNTTDETYLALNYVVGKTSDKETTLALSILDNLLMGNASSPLRKALEDSGIGYSVSGSFNDAMLQPTYSIIVEGTNEAQKKKFLKIVDSTLKNIVKNGFNKKLMDSVFNSYEISMRKQASAADRGNTYGDLVLKGWIYDIDPTTYLEINENITEIKKKSQNGYFEGLIKKHLLYNTHTSLVTLKPKAGLNEDNSIAIKKKLEKYKTSLSKKALNDIIKENGELKKWQRTPDSKSALQTIPALTIADINKKAEEIPTEVMDIKGIKVLKHLMYTNGVGYTKLYFDTEKIPQDKLMYLFLLSDILGKVDTKNYRYTQMGDLENTYTGGIGFETQCFVNQKNNQQYFPKMVVNTSFLDGNIYKSFDLISEIINNSKFTDRKRLKDIIKQIKSDVESTIQEDASTYAIRQAQSYLMDFHKYRNLKFIPYYYFICDIEKNFDKKANDIIKSLEYVKNLTFNRDNLIISFTGDEKQYGILEEKLKEFIETIKDEKYERQTYKFDYSVKNEGFIIASNVQQVVQAGDYRKEGYEYSGKLEVLSNIINNDYLYQQIRIGGGAYGAYSGISSSNILLYSYRDPNLKETLKVFEGLPEFLRKFKADEKEMINYIVGAIGSIDGLKDPADKAQIADIMYITGTSQEDVQKYRDEIITTTAEDIRNYADMVEKVIKQKNICVIGGENKLKSEGKVFTIIKKLIK